MRVPDLNWPADLFDDAAIPALENIATMSSSFRPLLFWTEMTDLWMGGDTPSVLLDGARRDLRAMHRGTTPAVESARNLHDCLY